MVPLNRDRFFTGFLKWCTVVQTLKALQKMPKPNRRTWNPGTSLLINVLLTRPLDLPQFMLKAGHGVSLGYASSCSDHIRYHHLIFLPSFPRTWPCVLYERIAFSKSSFTNMLVACEVEYAHRAAETSISTAGCTSQHIERASPCRYLPNLGRPGPRQTCYKDRPPSLIPRSTHQVQELGIQNQQG